MARFALLSSSWPLRPAAPACILRPQGGMACRALSYSYSPRLPAARDTVRAMRRKGATGTVLASLRGGTYLRCVRRQIVNRAYCAGLVGQPRAIAYSAFRRGIIGFTRSLTLELAAEGIQVNCVCPSNGDTPLMTNWINSQPDSAAVRRMMESVQALGRIASSDEVAKVVVFLASLWASFMAGEAIFVDGGGTLGD